MSGQLFVGTSGFAYKEWKGNFYPEKTPDKAMLSHYSKMLPSVEVNYTFRRLPSENSIQTWKSQTNPDFRFTLKASQRITHFKRLTNCQEDVDEFVRRARGLEERLGLIFFQTPPNLAFDPEVMDSFLKGLPLPFRYAMEFRHESFDSDEARQLMKDHGVAFCSAETEDQLVDDVVITAPHSYIRLRKENYEEQEISIWSKRIRALLDEGNDVYCYFKHEGGGVGPAYALSLKDQVG